MNDDLRIPLIISISIHLVAFLFTSIKYHRPIYIQIPIELVFYQQQIVEEKEEKVKEKDDIIIKKKKKPKKKKEKIVKKEKKKEPVKEVPSKPLQPSNTLSLDTVKFPFTYYTNMIVKKISKNWQWSTEFGRLKTVIYFKIMRSGAIESAIIKNPSGDTLFDQQAIRAVKLSSPFPPLPAGYNENTLGVYFEFAYKE